MQAICVSYLLPVKPKYDLYPEALRLRIQIWILWQISKRLPQESSNSLRIRPNGRELLKAR